jgi:hypothetical protein
VQIFPVPLEIDNWIPNQLSWPVKGDVPAALGLEKLHAFALKKLRRCDEMFLF